MPLNPTDVSLLVDAVIRCTGNTRQRQDQYVDYLVDKVLWNETHELAHMVREQLENPTPLGETSTTRLAAVTRLDAVHPVSKGESWLERSGLIVEALPVVVECRMTGCTSPAMPGYPPLCVVHQKDFETFCDRRDAEERGSK